MAQSDSPRRWSKITLKLARAAFELFQIANSLLMGYINRSIDGYWWSCLYALKPNKWKILLSSQNHVVLISLAWMRMLAFVSVVDHLKSGLLYNKDYLNAVLSSIFHRSRQLWKTQEWDEWLLRLVRCCSNFLCGHRQCQSPGDTYIRSQNKRIQKGGKFTVLNWITVLLVIWCTDYVAPRDSEPTTRK